MTGELQHQRGFFLLLLFFFKLKLLNNQREAKKAFHHWEENFNQSIMWGWKLGMDVARNSWFRDTTTEVYNNFTIFPNYLPLHM